MADETKTYGSTKRYGVRYGTKLKGKIGKIEAERRASTKCPYCHYGKAKRISAGIWHCLKCKAQFTGKAYTTGGKVNIKEEIPQPATAVEQQPEVTENFGEEEAEALEAEESEEEERE
ncbi:hypothetical protein HYU18_03580 [Candidatus Woesearchaeota archaeon]|nr:hypothetical protein [Candidatus Woesearchaeota archaeon]